MSLVALPVVFGLWQEGEYVRTSFEIASLRRSKLVLQERYRGLRIEKATLESLDRIEAEARRLGLIPPDASARAVHVPGPSAPSRGASGSRTASRAGFDSPQAEADSGQSFVERAQALAASGRYERER